MTQGKIPFILLCCVFLFPEFLQAQFSSTDKQMFQVSWRFGLDRQFYESSLERSFGKTSILVGIGGSSTMGSDYQYVSPEDAGDIKKRGEVVQSKTIDKFPTEYTPETYLESSSTKYRGAYIRVGVSHYFGARKSMNRLSGLYTGLDLIGMQTFENQTLTYRIDLKRGQTWVASDENRFYTLGIALKTGYVWFPFKQELCCIRLDVSHPFYIPFTDEINVSGPFTGGHFEGSLSVGIRIGAR